MGNCLTSGGTVLQATQVQGTSELKRNYKITHATKQLGHGAFGKVFLTHNRFNTSHWVAIKLMNKKKLVDP